MGLIALLFMGTFLFAIALIIFGYVIFVHFILKYAKSKKSKSISITAISFIVTALFYILYNFYQTNDNMQYMKGFFGIAPTKSHTIELNTDKGKLNFIIELDFNTGARGGAFIKNSFFYITNNKKKEIIVTQHEINMSNNYYKKALKIQRIADENKNHKGYGKYYIDLYFSPNIFSIEEYKQISDFLKHNHKILSKKINNYKENQKSEIYNKTRFRDTYYQDIDSLKKIYNCSNNLQLHLSATGRMFYITKSDISTSLIDIGDIKDNGHKLLLNKYVKLSKKSGKYQLIRGNTLIEECFDSNGTNLFEEFKLEKM
jgi:hypothetical protein